MKFNESDIGRIIGFYDDNGDLQISSIFEVKQNCITTDLGEEIHNKDIVDVGFVDLEKHDKLQARIKELESDKHVNEIKANYLEWIIKTIEDKHNSIDPIGLYEPAIDLKTLKGEIEKLRGKLC